MSAAVPLRGDFSDEDLRRLARASRDVGQSRKPPDVLNVDEAGPLLAAASGLKHEAGIAYRAGVRVSEVAALESMRSMAHAC